MSNFVVIDFFVVELSSASSSMWSILCWKLVSFWCVEYDVSFLWNYESNLKGFLGKPCSGLKVEVSSKYGFVFLFGDSCNLGGVSTLGFRGIRRVYCILVWMSSHASPSWFLKGGLVFPAMTISTSSNSSIQCYIPISTNFHFYPFF